MKKILAILAMLAILAGCAPVQEPVPTENQPPVMETDAPAAEATEATEAETIPPIPQLPMVAVSVPLSVDTVKTDSGDSVYRNTKQTMYLTARDPSVADGIILDFLNRVDSHTDAAEAVRKASESATTEEYAWGGYFYDLIYNPTRVDHSVLSLYGEAAYFDGGLHSQRICTAANYNMVTGDVLTLGSILYHIDSKAALGDLVLEKLQAIAEEKYLLDGYEDVVRKRFQRDESFDEDWYFTTQGICFYFAPYEIAPFASGVISAEIPYAELSGIIADEFFPAEQDLSQGSILCVPMGKADMAQFTQIAELTLDAEGDMFFLYTDGTLRNITIETGLYNAEREEFLPKCTVFGTYTLTPGDSVMLKLAISQEMEDLRLTYESGGQVHSILLTEAFLSGE